jgi:hypothetical protein
LHQSSNLARLIIQERHVFLVHGRPDRTLHDVHSRYHIGRIRTVVKAVIGNCAKCSCYTQNYPSQLWLHSRLIVYVRFPARSPSPVSTILAR